jgi:molybdate transport repressor ModE-like protein
MSHPHVRRRGKPTILIPRVKGWLEVGRSYAFGYGLSKIREAVGRAGSIKQAAGDLGLSYRYVWGRIKEAESAPGRRLVETHVGGRDPQRSALTPEARRLVADFLALRARMTELVQREFARHFGGR